MNRYIPKQHGAWAMLVVPFLIGASAAQPRPLHGLLFAGWLLMYLFAYPLLQLIRTGKTERYQAPLLLYGAALCTVGAILLFLHPPLLRLIPWFVPLFLVNIWYALHNRERAFANDLAAVVQFSLVVFVAYEMGGGRDGRLAGELFGLSVAYFTGTVFYVKTMIREKYNSRFYLLSVGYHVLLLTLGFLWFHPVMLLPWTVLMLRAMWFPKLNLTVKRTGISEIVFSVVVALTAVSVYG